MAERRQRHTAVRRIQFCAGHRVHRHESKCRHIHGHNYVAFLHAEVDYGRDGLDDVGRVVDFGVLKEVVGGWVEEWWDHAFLVWFEDPLALMFESAGALAEHRHFVMPYNPTAENMAAYLLDRDWPELRDAGVRLAKVVLWETENCYAEAV